MVKTAFSAGSFWRLINDCADRFDPDWRNSVAAEAASNEKAKALRRKLHQTIHKVGGDIEEFAFNTAVAALMELVNEMYAYVQSGGEIGNGILSEAIESLILLLSPMTPHIADELWETIGKSGFTLEAAWPDFDPEVAKADEIELVIQINGKLRDRVTVPADSDDETLKATALAREKIKSDLEGKTIRKVIVVQGKLVNVVAS